MFLDAAFDPGFETLGPLAKSSEERLIAGVRNLLGPLVVQDEHEVEQQTQVWVNAIRNDAALAVA